MIKKTKMMMWRSLPLLEKVNIEVITSKIFWFAFGVIVGISIAGTIHQMIGG